MSEALALAADYFLTDDEDMQQTGWLALLLWARDLEVPAWDCGTEKSSGNAFTSHIEHPRSSFKYTPKGSGPVKQEHLNAGRQGHLRELQKSAITL